MALSIRWVLAGAVAVMGGLWFAARATMTLHLHFERPVTALCAFALGGFVAGAMMTRHAALSRREPLLASILASVVLGSLGYASRDLGMLTQPVAQLSTTTLLLAAVLVISSTVIGGEVGRRVHAVVPSTASLLLLASLVTLGLTMLVSVALATLLGSRHFPGWYAVLVLVAVAGAGYVTQAMITVRRPWTSACGGFLILLLFLEDGRIGRGDIFVGALAMGFMTVIGWIGARLACHVHRDRLATPPSDLPTARI